MSIRVIILDVDGTLVNDDKQITEKTKQALLKAQQQGIRLVLASGRPERGMIGFAQQLDMHKNHGLIVCYNGGLVKDIQTNEILFSKPMSYETAKAILEMLKKYEVGPIIDQGEYMYVYDAYNCMITHNGVTKNIVEYETRTNHCKVCEKDNLAELFHKPTYKIMIFGQPEYLAAHEKELAGDFGDEVNSMITADYYFEYMPNGIDKVTALKDTLNSLGYQREEMLVFGDSGNDVEMLKYAGIGVAMGNSKDSIKAIADDVTLSNNEDGIAEYLKKILK